jgi:hypothetical protein
MDLEINQNELPYIIKLNEKGDSIRPGKLVAINDYEIHMPIKRIFYLYDFDKDTSINKRGCHAHKNAIQILINLSGSVDIYTTHILTKEERHFKLDSPSIALKLPINNYINLNNFTENSVMIVLCDKVFEEDIYVK